MYLRHSTVRKADKTYTYWRLVRSVRRNGKVKQETVAQLGELDEQGRANAQALAEAMTGRPTQMGLFDKTPPPTEAVSVKLNEVRVERGRRFGDVWLGLTLWQALGLDELCESYMPQGRAKISWAAMAAILVIARLCEPSSELYIAENWYRRTALDDLLGVPAQQVNDDRLYRALDQLLPHKETLQKHLAKRLGELFSIDYEILLYDVTSTYFEGQAAKNPMAKRGHSRDKRSDCKQVCIALVVTRDGIPLGYEVFDGNRTDVTTVEEIVGTMERQYGKAQRVWVMDRGMTSKDNIAWLQEGGRRYLIGANKQEIKKFAPEVRDERNWQEVRDGVEAKLCDGPDGKETFVLVRSAKRKAKEQAMYERFAKRIEDGLASLERRLERSRKPLKRGPIERQIGRLLGKNTRASSSFQIDVIEDSSRASGWKLEWSENAQWKEWAQYSQGCYILRTNIRDWSSEELWKTYIQLTDAEAAFRIHKTELSLRPIWHQRADRVQAHILVCFLAYVMWKTLEQWQKRAGLGNSPRTILDELGTIQSTDVVLPTATSPSRELRIRCVVRPDRSQAALLDRLGLRLPKRLSSPL